MADDVSVTVDHVACEGTGFCVRSMPKVFALSDGGVAEVDESQLPAVSVGELREVENMCPTTAIRVRTG